MININNLNFAYTKKHELFSDLNLKLPDGNIYGLLGKNGAGKSTLLKIISGLLYPKKGECLVLNQASRYRSPELLTDIFFIAEDFHIPNLRVSEYLRLYSPFYPAFNTREFLNNLNEFSIPEKEKLTSLSYGQKKKFLIAFGLAANTRLLIMDEPTNGLDIPSKSQFRKLLASAISDERIFLISTHQVRDMQQLIDPVIILDNGSIIFQQSMSDVNDKFCVRLLKNEPGANDSLYFEKVIGGYSALCVDNSGESTGVDLEILFNAAVSGNDKLNAVFGR